MSTLIRIVAALAAFWRRLPSWLRAAVTTSGVVFVSTTLSGVTGLLNEVQAWAGGGDPPDLSALGSVLFGAAVSFLAGIVNAVLRRWRPPENAYPGPAPTRHAKTVGKGRLLTLLPLLALVAFGALAVTRVAAKGGGGCPDDRPILTKWDEWPWCNPDGDNSLHLYYGPNWGATDVQNRCADVGGHAHKFTNHGGHYLCVNVDF